VAEKMVATRGSILCSSGGNTVLEGMVYHLWAAMAR